MSRKADRIVVTSDLFAIICSIGERYDLSSVDGIELSRQIVILDLHSDAEVTMLNMKGLENDTVITEAVEAAYSYQDYRDLIEKRLTDEKTTGENHSEERLHHSRMNLFRMKRLDKFARLEPGLQERLRNLKKRFLWVVLTEGWSSDAAQSLPIINKISDFASGIELRILLRDEHLDLMDQFPGDGNGHMIPRLVCFDADTREVLGTWGPQPRTAQEITMTLSNRSGISPKEAAEELLKWYVDNRNEEIQREFLELIKQWDD